MKYKEMDSDINVLAAVIEAFIQMNVNGKLDKIIDSLLRMLKHMEEDLNG